MGRVVPSEEVRSYPANGYGSTQRMGTTLSSSWVQDDPTAGYKIHEKRHQNDVIMNIMFNLNLIHND